jgi:hypothetical protein
VKLQITRKTALFFVGAMTTCLSGAYIVQEHRDGYKDTPIIPGQKWHVHDSDRPYPPEVVPGAVPGAPPSDAIVLFDGKDLSQWTQQKDGQDVEPKWKLVDGTMQVVSGYGYMYTKEKFGDCQLHIEWQESPDITGKGQGRGNSGVFLQSLYEVQVLDSYRAPTYADGQAGAMYGQWPPMVNPMTKPGTWQTYDIFFEAPKFEGGKLVSPAYVTLLFNGVLVHNHQKYNGPTAHREVLGYTDMVTEGRLALQDHGPAQPLRFRNIWIRKLKGYDQP